MADSTTPDRICIIGAGSSGLAACHRFIDAGFAVDVYERAADLGGNWNYASPWSRVFDTTHLVSSKRLTEYLDYPMPADYPDFPSHRQAQQYFQSYTDHFELRRHIHFSTSVEKIRRQANGGWLVTLDDGRTLPYQGIAIANGHNWSPRKPQIPGSFTGRILHAAEYRSSEIMRGKRVVVVGAGNSGCDIATEAAQVADVAVHSVRRGYHIMPKYVGKWPTDLFAEFFLRLKVPLWMRRAVGNLILAVYAQELWRYGYPRPDHRLWESHLVLNNQLAHHVRHGKVLPKPDIARVEGSRVFFVDGSSVEADLLILATGYRTEFPFLDPSEVPLVDGVPELYLSLFSQRYDDLVVLGLMQPSQGQWQLVDFQARAVAAFWTALRTAPKRADKFRSIKSGTPPHLGGRIRYVDSPRHRIELDHGSYRKRMQRILKLLASPALPRPVDQAGPAELALSQSQHLS